ncbi:hypothetical protein F5Y12DRAFT_795940 [Xylaria sp. FL1777]|nr:hypothetical protein F5Y12DRAFT_795940 [Xylaria sp. FL1777]
MPISRYAVRLTQRITDYNMRNITLNLIEIATRKPDLAGYTIATLMNPSHTSNSDPRPHVTALLATESQEQANTSQALHIYHDKDWNYAGHMLFPERKNKTNKD